MTDREAFERALEKDMYDIETRLVFADWLEENRLDNEAYLQRHMARKEWVEARMWLEWFASEVTEPYDDYGTPPLRWDVTLDSLVEAGEKCASTGSKTCISGMGFHAESLMEDPQTRETFWRHWQEYTGNKLSSEEDLPPYQNPFSCCRDVNLVAEGGSMT